MTRRSRRLMLLLASEYAEGQCLRRYIDPRVRLVSRRFGKSAVYNRKQVNLWGYNRVRMRVTIGD